jgi:hypothetical protein
MFFATYRQPDKDLIYQTRVEKPVTELEQWVPPQATYATYTAASHLLTEAAADYGKLYFYLDSKQQHLAQKRFPPTDKTRLEPNIYVWQKPPQILSEQDYTNLILTFADLWNLKDWYAQDFVTALQDKINQVRDKQL